jgi:hypothetical protein
MVKGEKAVVDQPAPLVPPDLIVTFNLNKPAEATGTPAFGDSFTSTKTVKKGYFVGELPTATLTDYIFKGWAETATGTAAIQTSKKIYVAKTVYAIWEDAASALPDATEDKVITPKIATFGGLGAHQDDAGYGPHLFSNEQSSQATLWFSFKSEVETATYKSVEIKYTAVEVIPEGGESANLPKKLIFRKDRGDNEWSGSADEYEDVGATVDTEMTRTLTITDVMIDKGIQIQHNKGVASCNFNLTITKITLLKP